MYGSYGSYSSMSSITQPMDIAPRSQSTYDAHCAFPSWPRRESLSESDRVERPTSYLSDDDLFLSDPFDDTASVSSGGSAGSPAISPPAVSEAEIFEMQQQRMALQRQYLQQMVIEKEQRRRAAQKQQKKRSSSGSSRKSPKSKLSSMTPIAE